MKLLNILKDKPFCNDLHLFLIPILLLILGFRYYFFFIFLLIYLIYLFKKTKLIFPVILSVLLFTFIISLKNTFKYINQYKTSFKGIITDVVNDNTFDMYSNGIYIRCYLKGNTYEIGDIVDISGTNIENTKAYEEDFSYNEYLESKGISKYFSVTKIDKINHIFLLNSLKYSYLGYLKSKLSSESYSYTSTMVFQSNELDSNIKDSYSILGISHILAISGLHIIFLYSIISFILLKLFKYYKKTIPLIILGIYVLFIGMPSSALRSYLFLLIASINKGKIKYTRLDILSISAIISLLFNPYRLFDVGFILSYLVSFIIIFSNEFINRSDSLIKKYLLYIIIFLTTIPYTVSISNHISLLGLLLSPILSIIIGYIILPISYILSLIPSLDYLLKYIFIFINLYITNLSSYSLLIPVISFNIWMKLIYYVVLIFLYYSILTKTNLIISFLYFSIYLISILSINYINPLYQITYLSVGQGDSILVRCPNNKGNMLIDCYNSYDYLKNRGINRIDYLVITHSDSDHLGDYLKIIDNINVINILYPKYDSKAYEIFKDYSNSIMVDYNNSFYLSNIYVDILGPINEYSEANSVSIVLRFEIEGHKFLFTGDCTKEEELDLIDKYNNYLDIDVLKVGHHGSITSSSIEFLNVVTPRISIVSVGINNRYGLPDIEVINRLNKISEVYETRYCGNINISIFMNKLRIQKYH